MKHRGEPPSCGVTSLTNGVEDLRHLVVLLDRGFHEEQAFALRKFLPFLKEKVSVFNGSPSRGTSWLTHKKLDNAIIINIISIYYININNPSAQVAGVEKIMSLSSRPALNT